MKIVLNWYENYMKIRLDIEIFVRKKFTKRIFRPLTKSLSNCKGLLEAVIPNHLIRGDALSK